LIHCESVNLPDLIRTGSVVKPSAPRAPFGCVQAGVRKTSQARVNPSRSMKESHEDRQCTMDTICSGFNTPDPVYSGCPKGRFQSGEGADVHHQHGPGNPALTGNHSNNPTINAKQAMNTTQKLKVARMLAFDLAIIFAVFLIPPLFTSSPNSYNYAMLGLMAISLASGAVLSLKIASVRRLGKNVSNSSRTHVLTEYLELSLAGTLFGIFCLAYLGLLPDRCFAPSIISAWFLWEV
jgi:hypothetical protein